MTKNNILPCVHWQKWFIIIDMMGIPQRALIKENEEKYEKVYGKEETEVPPEKQN